MNEKLLAPGWYVVKETEKYELHRYWNGMRWSAPCYSDDPHEVVVRAMNTPADSDSDIKCLRPASLRPTEPAPRRACECQPGKCLSLIHI